MSDNTMGNQVFMGNNVVIEQGVVLGNNITIYDDVIIKQGAIIGDNVTLGYCEPPGPKENRMTEIGEQVQVRSGVVIYYGTRVGPKTIIDHYTVMRENTSVGHDSFIGTFCFICENSVIGNYVSIHALTGNAPHSIIDDFTYIGPGTIPTNDNALAHRRRGHGQNLKGFIIEKNVTIIGRATILPGVRLGEGCVVAAGSLINRDVPPYTLVMGTPARVIREISRDEMVIPAPHTEE